MPSSQSRTHPIFPSSNLRMPSLHFSYASLELPAIRLALPLAASFVALFMFPVTALILLFDLVRRSFRRAPDAKFPRLSAINDYKLSFPLPSGWGKPFAIAQKVRQCECMFQLTRHVANSVPS